MEIGLTTRAANRSAWRRWLERHHGAATEAWLVLQKKNSPYPNVTYDEAVEEALCFGWIDSQNKTIDEHSYAQRFTPRKLTAQWSANNIERARRLVEQRRMTASGLA